MREMFSDMPFMCGVVAVVGGVALSLASVAVVGRCVFKSSDEVFVEIFLRKKMIKLLVLVGCLSCCVLVALVALES